MIQLPKHLRYFQSEAQGWLMSGAVEDIEYSGGTYQVLIADRDTKKKEWAFLQLDRTGKLKDSFCSCNTNDVNHECIHQAVAFLYIFGCHTLPLHIRFQSSLWNCLFQQCAETIGMDPLVFKVVQEGHYIYRPVGKKIIFSLTGLSPSMIERLETILFSRRQQTEETSLKFSNLPQEEIVLWRLGKPTSKLRYELSFWNDLAQLLMFWQESEIPYSISFDESPNKLLHRIHILFPDLILEFFLSETSLAAIIPALSTVKSKLTVHGSPEDTIEKVLYDKEKKSLIIVSRQVQSNSARDESRKKIPVDGWIYVPGDGFYSQNPHFLLTAGELTGEALENALNEYAPIMRGLAEGFKIHDTPVQVSYAISFDKDWGLHITGYLFTPGDLSADSSYCFASWAYLANDGFYPIEKRYFENLEIIIPSEEVSDFVALHRFWFNHQDGFRTHLSRLEAELNYYLDSSQCLFFSPKLAIKGHGLESKDFGKWVYIAREGFFSKINTQTNLPVRTGSAIPPNQISMFIRMNHDELQLIKGFFSAQSPLVKCLVNIQLTKQDQILIEPELELLPEYHNKKVALFDDYTYVEGEGFHEIPSEIRLPERFRHPLLIEDENILLFIKDLPSLEPYIHSIDFRLRAAANLRLSADVIESEKRDNYSLNLNYLNEFGSVSIASLWNCHRQKKRFVFSDAGLIDLSEKKFNWLKILEKEKVERKSNTIELSTLELLRLNAFDEISVHPGKDYAKSKNLMNRLIEFQVPAEPDLAGLQSHLRPYQQIGVRWLWFLYHHGLSGLLCDDMGLGKTHQAMALLAAITNDSHSRGSQKKQRFLIICPTSVIYHWQEKLSAFLPNLRVWTFYGAKRTLENYYDNCDVLLTSYGIWRNEADLLVDHPFEVAIFDEVQIAKNHNSRIYSALLMTNAKIKIGLSGTPIENHLRELKALFDITLPTYMPSDSDYREFFVKPIEKEGNRERKELLSRLIKPFVMRRKKEDVLLDLPEKTEDIAHCDLLPQQRKLYTDVLTASRDKIIDELHDETRSIPYMHVFALLSHLKQICNHPAAYLKKPFKYQDYHSGKWDLFVELLNEARESKQKVVVFSQYLAMLDIIEAYLKEMEIGFATIRGATINRGDQLQRFKKEPDCEVFVASLQAAGLGVDLTAASVVIHYDRWWNAARENQATDRVHRIGQERGVQVFKLMTKQTIEEHIDLLIAKKGKLMDDIVAVDDHQIIKKFDRKEIIQLLQVMPG